MTGLVHLHFLGLSQVRAKSLEYWRAQARPLRGQRSPGTAMSLRRVNAIQTLLGNEESHQGASIARCRRRKAGNDALRPARR